jgi:uridylate kinase
VISLERVAIKVSGESLGRLDASRTIEVAKAIASINSMGVGQIVVVGGGNLFRRHQAHEWGIGDYEADEAGMIATGLNVRLLDGVLAAMGVASQIFSRGPCIGIGIPYVRESVCAQLAEGRVVLIAGGMGISGVSTDYPAIHAAIDTGAAAVIMAKHDTDGVYTADPRKDSRAVFLPEISATEALNRQLQVMDPSALTLAREHGKEIHIVNADDPNNIKYVIEGKEIGSVIRPL